MPLLCGLQVVAEKTKEYGSKSWGFLKNAYAAAASTIEQTAAANGYRVDLGECPQRWGGGGAALGRHGFIARGNEASGALPVMLARRGALGWLVQAAG